MARTTDRSHNGRSDEAARRVTVKALAEAVGLSQPAVSQVLNNTGRIAAATRQRVLAMAEQMGYRPDAAARAVVTRKTRQVGVLVLNNPADPYTFPDAYFTILGVNMALESAGYVLCLVRIGDVEQSIEGHSRVFRERVLDGVIVTTSLPDRVARRIEELVPACVWADTNRWAATGCVRRDEAAAGRAAAQAAVDAGYAKLLFLTEETDSGNVPDHYSHTERARGVAAVCRRHDVPLETMRHDWHWTPRFAEQLVGRLGPDVAVVASDAFRARIVQEAAAVHGRRIGSDFGLACCDTGGLTTATWPNLAGVTFDRVELGRRAAEMMLSLLETGRSPESVRLPDTWRGGATLGPRAG